MKLRDLSSDMILAELERRSEALTEIEQKVAELDSAFKAYEAASALAIKNTGVAMNEATNRVRAAPEWSERYLELQSAIVEEKERRRAYQRAEKAMSMWQTEKGLEKAVLK